MLTWMVLALAMAQENNVPKELPNPVTLTITGAGTGDRGCYLSGIENTKAQTAWEFMAEHGCEDLLEVGKSYVLTWREGSVLAAVCEGDVDCPHSDTEAIVTDIAGQRAPKATPKPTSPEEAPTTPEATPEEPSAYLPARGVYRIGRGP